MGGFGVFLKLGAVEEEEEEEEEEIQAHFGASFDACFGACACSCFSSWGEEGALNLVLVSYS